MYMALSLSLITKVKQEQNKDINSVMQMERASKT